MKALFVLLILSVVTIVIAAIAVRWRLRRHLQQSDQALKETLLELEAEQASVEQR